MLLVLVLVLLHHRTTMTTRISISSINNTRMTNNDS